MTITETQNSIIKQFSELTDWDEKYSMLIKMGRELPELSEKIKTAKYKLDGCQSRVWMNAKLEDGKVIIIGDSDAMIVKGLVAILIKAYSDFAPSEILSTPPSFLSEIGIDKHLSLTRKNGLGAMLKQIQLFAIAYKAMAEKEKNL
ncbi:MAG: SufE family protein [Melioribacteraceae bacterium]